MNISTSSNDSQIHLTSFGQLLISSGELIVKRYVPGQSFDETGFEQLVCEWGRVNRAELPSSAPEIDYGSAFWAAKKLYAACQFLVCREESEDALRTALSGEFPSSRNAVTDFSVDLFFQYLPDLFAISNRVAPGDALTQVLTNWAADWPLSSVGIALPGPCKTQTFDGNPALLRLYTDRIAERFAKDRLENPLVCDVLKRDSGLYPELLPFLPSVYSHA